MIGARRRYEQPASSISSTCTSASGGARWSDLSPTLPINPALLSPQRSLPRTTRRFIFPVVPAAWLPVSPASPRTALRELCSPRQEPRPPANVLNRSHLGSCSPSLAKFSRTTTDQHVSTSTSTTTLPSSSVHPSAFLHPTMTYLTVNGLRTQHHQRSCRHAR
jgi:hypothetical protein